MANYCYFNIKANGTKENLLKFKEIVQSNYNYQKQEDGTYIETECSGEHLFRIFSADVDLDDIDNGSIFISGDCAWSVYSCMFEGLHTYYSDSSRFRECFKGTTIPKISKELNLDIEIFSEENGCGFMEHFLVKEGEVIKEECVDWDEEEDEETGDFVTTGGMEWDFAI